MAEESGDERMLTEFFVAERAVDQGNSFVGMFLAVKALGLHSRVCAASQKDLHDWIIQQLGERGIHQDGM
jgi:hypothetical protein